MFFELKFCDVDDDPGGQWWQWTYRQGTDKNPGDVLARGPRMFDSEREARSQIAVARKAFGGARMAKVVLTETPGSSTIRASNS